MKRPYRSLLFMPGHRPDLVAKGVASGADAIVLDLEDAVPVAEKVGARGIVAESIRSVREDGHDVGLFVRPNGLATGATGSDMTAVAQEGLDGFFVPKVETTVDVHRYLALMEHAEHKAGIGGLNVIVPIETARAIVNVEAIVGVPRVGAVVGPTARHADIAREVGFQWTPEGLESLYLRSRILVAARAAGVFPLTGLWEDVRDLDGLRQFATRGRGMGFRGQIVIHPSHVAAVNDVFTPTKEEIAFYEGLITAFEAAEREGRGALIYEDRHIDIAHVETARRWLEFAASVGGRG